MISAISLTRREDGWEWFEGAAASTIDAINMIFYLDASRNHDLSLPLEKITAPRLSTHTVADVWKDYLAEFLRETEPR